MSRGAPLRVGTRASALALAQAGTVAARLAALGGVDVELVRVRTEGDRSTGSLAALGGTGVFVAALREAVLAGRCDVAVHSLKDLPTGPAEGLVLAAVPPREDPRDVLCASQGRSLAKLPLGAKIGTGSPRRAAQLLATRPDLQVLDIRGNVDTRLARVGGDLDAVVLARAGLARLGRLDAVTETFEPMVMVPAPGQGALAVECRAEDATHGAPAVAYRALDDAASRAAVTAERALLARLEAGCTAPVGALARPDAAGGLVLVAVVLRPDGQVQLRRTGTAGWDPASPDLAAAAELGTRLADELLGAGAAALAGPRRPPP